jgi:hypothetical protein
MIFDSSRLGKTIAATIQSWPVDGSNLANSTSAYRTRVVVGTGAQPTPSEVETNWSTEYYLNDTGNTGTAGNSILCGFGDLWVDSSVNDVVWDLSFTSSPTANYIPDSSTLYLNSNTIPKSYYFKNGTANWAIIWFNEALTMSSASFPNDNFIVVPVTDTSGNGIVKLDTVTINNSSAQLVSMTFSFFGGV